ncbi:type II and III secretion system protein family protein [Croceicoccus sp. Ery15]|uniref:type II and III secretion system protein family protein n=1 Tax=Croceicoccus sp. Ery15 TaxID=1703338 RepID=UPI001E2DCDB4|nr:type II and III secretion system protein family protein [Croceicoccus sp. Ery15]
MRKKSIIAAFALATTLPFAAPAMAQDYGLHAGGLEVPINKSQVVTSDRAISRAMVGNAEIADVLPISDRSIYVLGKAPGTTSLTLYDRSNQVIAVMDVTVGPDVDGIRSELAALLPGEDVTARLSAGSVILSGFVSDAGAASRASRIAEAFAGDKVVNLLSVGGSQQVMLEVRFAEVNRTVGSQFGVRSSGISNDGDFGFAIGGASAPSSAFGVIGTLFNLGDVNIEAYLDTLEGKGMAKTLAEPTLVALSGEPASFLAGGEFPIPVAGGAGGNADAITVTFKTFGVSLAFTPTVLGNNVINLLVEPEVSSLDPSASVTVNDISVPGLQTRRASTTLELRDGESFAIAGLLREDMSTTVSQMPLLGSIPILGSLFRSTEYQKGQTELLIVVTPRLVKPIRPGYVNLPTDRVEDPDPLDVHLVGDDYQPVPLAPAAPAAAATVQEVPDYEY